MDEGTHRANERTNERTSSITFKPTKPVAPVTNATRDDAAAASSDVVATGGPGGKRE